MKILMNEDIDICGAINRPIAIVPEDNEQLHKVLSKHLGKAQADAIINEGEWFSKDGCEAYYVKSIDDWSI
jgi:hypothetical protein